MVEKPNCAGINEESLYKLGKRNLNVRQKTQPMRPGSRNRQKFAQLAGANDLVMDAGSASRFRRVISTFIVRNEVDGPECGFIETT